MTRRSISLPRSCRFFLALVALAALLAGAAAAKEKEVFRAKPAESYPARDTHEGLVVAGEPFDRTDEGKLAFGKADPMKAGFLPVLLVIENRTTKTVRFDQMSIQYVTYDRQKIEPTPPEQVARASVPGRKDYPEERSPFPQLPGRKKPKTASEVLANAFEMRMLPPGGTATGFVYFEIGRRHNWVSGARVVLSGMRWANNNQELMYYELDLDKSTAAQNRATQ